MGSTSQNSTVGAHVIRKFFLRPPWIGALQGARELRAARRGAPTLALGPTRSDGPLDAAIAAFRH
eukprot:COSAG05_NODE_231_length_13343_cov_199.670417_5_plen_65_part_00